VGSADSSRAAATDRVVQLESWRTIRSERLAGQHLDQSQRMTQWGDAKPGGAPASGASDLCWSVPRHDGIGSRSTENLAPLVRRADRLVRFATIDLLGVYDQDGRSGALNRSGTVRANGKPHGLIAAHRILNRVQES
jgi:hypothetical protein